MKNTRSFARLSWVMLLLLTSVCAFAQHTVKGTVLDKDTSEPVIGAAVVIDGTTTGTVTDFDGNFSLGVDALPANITISFLGYSSQSLNAKISNLGTVLLAADNKALDEVVVKSAIAVARKTPVALSSIAPDVLEEKIGTKDLPEVLRSTPSVYVSNAGGGYGDTEILMRGFKSANIAVMVNGVPVNDMEWGGVYQSNWQGLGDVIRTIQTQRGLGASKISAPSVGGTVSYITRGLDAKKGGSVSYAVGSDGYNKMMVTLSSGMNKKGWAFNVSLAKVWGDGYYQGTDFEGYNWFVNVAKRINENHQLSFTALGAPQWHNQRNAANGLSIAQWQKVKDYMNGESEYRYNPVYGFDKNGKTRTSNRNVYNKPQLSLNHQWQISDKQSLSSSVYMSIGRGYGYSGQGNKLDAQKSYSNSSWYGASNGTLNNTFRHEDGTFAYDMIQEINEASELGSYLVMSVSKNYHTWVGLISNYDNKINDEFELSGGIDFRWYKGQHTNEIIDLYNGDYYMDVDSRSKVKPANNSAANNPNFKYEKLHVGDVVYRDYDGFTVQGGIFAQLEYSKEKLNAYVSGSVSNTTYWRYDRFYYDSSHAKSETVDFWGFTVKGGANYNIDDHNNVFVNTGYISRAPFFSGGAFLSSAVSNATNPDAVNEKCYSAEVGYGFHNSIFEAKVNAYYTKWMDQTMAKSSDFTNAAGQPDRYTINLSGVDARHMGVELEANVTPTNWLEVNGMLSVGNWVDDCEATGFFFDQTGQPLKRDLKNTASGVQADDHARMTLILDNVKVGEAAQTTAAVGVKVKPMKGLKIGIEYNLAAKHYADWTIKANDITAGDATDGDPRGQILSYSSPWRIPSYNLFDLNAGYSFMFGEKVTASLSGNVNNLFDVEYIQNGDDGSGHDWKTFYGFYGKGRTYSVKMKLNF